MVGTTFPAYIRAEYKNDGRAFDQFVSDVGRAGGKAKTAMEQALSGVRDTVAQALSVPRNAFGSLDVGVGELRKMEAQLEATAQASRQVQIALVAEARATDGNAQSKVAAIRAANQFARASEEELANLRQNIAFNERLQAELNKTAAAHQNVYGAAARGTTAYQANTQSVRAMRQATTQAGQQLQDIVISMGSGQRASTVLAQQLPQLAFAFSDVGGKVGAVARFLSGPWGVTVAIGAFALGPLIDNLFKSGDASNKAGDAYKTTAEKLDLQKNSVEAVTKALKEYNSEQEKSRVITLESAKATALKIAEDLRETIGIRTKLKALIEESSTRLQIAFAQSGGNVIGALGSYLASESQLKSRASAQDAIIEELKKGAKNAVIEVADEVAKINSDPSYKLDVGFDAMRNDARNSIKDFNALQKKLTEINNQEKAAKKALSESKKKPRSISESATDGPSLSRSKGNEFLSTAKQFSGLSENNRSDNLTLQSFFKAAGVQSIDPKITAWCAAFVNAVLATNGVKGNGALTAASFKTYGQGVDKPQLGDIVVLKPRQGKKETGHVGFYAGKGKNGGVLVTGGNQGNEVSTDEFALNRVAAYRRAPNDSQQSALDTAKANAAEQFAKELDRIEQLAQRISGEFDDQPKLIDRIAISSLKVQQATASIDRDLADANTTTEQRVALEARKLELAQAQLLVDGYIGKQIQKTRDDFNDQMQVQKLILAGREEEARVLERIQQKDKEFGLSASIEAQKELLKIQNETLAADDATAEQKEQAKTIIAETTPLYEKNLMLQGQIADEAGRQVRQEIAVGEAIERRNRSVQAYRSYIDGTYSSLEKLLSGGKASDFFKEFKSGFKQLQGSLLTDKLFGGAFDELRRFNNRRSPENIATANYVEQVNLGTNAVADFAQAVVSATNKIAANDNPSSGSPQSMAARAFGRAGGGIVVDAKKTIPVRLANESLSDFVTRLSSSIVTPFTSELDKIFGTKFFGALSGVLSGALAGYARAGKVGAVLGAGQSLFGKLTDSGLIKEKLGADISNVFGKALKGAETGDAIAGIFKSIGIKSSRTGGQVGGAVGGLFGGALGEFIGGTVGSIVGGLFKKTKKGNLTVSNSAVSSSGSRSLLGGLNEGGGQIQDRISAIAEQLGGTVGSYSLAIKQKGKKFTFGGQKFDDFESAAEAALLSAIQNGAVQGITAGAQRLLQAGKDLERQLDKALKFQNVFDRLKEIDDPVGAALDRLDREFTNLRSIFAEAGASAEEYAQLQRLYELDRAKAIEEANSRVSSSLKSLLNDLTVGNDARSLGERRQFAIQAYDPLAARVAAGDRTAYDAYADAARQLLDIERQIFGSQSGYFDRLNEVTGLTQTRIAAEDNVTSIDRLGLTFTDSITTQTQALLGGLVPVLNAINDNLGAVTIPSTLPGGTLFNNLGGTYF